VRLLLLLVLVLKSLAGLHMFLHLDDINKIEDAHVADDADVVLEQGESGEQRRCADKYFKRWVGKYCRGRIFSEAPNAV